MGGAVDAEKSTVEGRGGRGAPVSRGRGSEAWPWLNNLDALPRSVSVRGLMGVEAALDEEERERGEVKSLEGGEAVGLMVQ